MEQNTSKIIETDMITVKKNLDVYLKQYFLINNKEPNEKNLLNNADNISRELGSEIGNKVEIYNINGVSELHAAAFKKDKIESDIIAYSNLKHLTFFKWSKDGNRLFLFTDSNRGTTIYRFFSTMKEPKLVTTNLSSFSFY